MSTTTTRIDHTSSLAQIDQALHEVVTARKDRREGRLLELDGYALWDAIEELLEIRSAVTKENT